jgi:hypothetical protein
MSVHRPKSYHFFVCFFPLDRRKDLFTLSIPALILEVLLEEAIYVAIPTVLDSVEQSRTKYLSGLTALK